MIGLGLCLAVLAACTTTADTNQVLKSRWIGQPSDLFFSRYGPPLRSFALNDGGTVYTWRGGETTRTVAPARRSTLGQPSAPFASRVRTTTTVTHPNANTTVTKTRSSSFSVGLQPAVGQMLVQPPRVERLFCEAQITGDAGGTIRNVEASRDTAGAGFSLSRCAEVFEAG